MKPRQICFRKITQIRPTASRLIHTSKECPDLLDSQQQRQSFLKPFHHFAFMLRNSFLMYCILALSFSLSLVSEEVEKDIQNTYGEKKSNCREYCFCANKSQSFDKWH
ncbi:hypothetical protein CEXT_351611 [Caerostris extrusa]|uniref:Uncharacterized protein n=1 Tax=Caerostris extrusa TaxID=172846 RepID=A0AAV4T2N5_CAEEX|nr:hypothetical protein CEXT_351611 [Caerostris extrusa]